MPSPPRSKTPTKKPVKRARAKAAGEKPQEASRAKVQRYRDRMRAQGFRPIQIWVPDVRSEAFRKEARRQSLAVAQSPHEKDDQAFVDSISEWNDE
jgi:hypothetical protein